MTSLTQTNPNRRKRLAAPMETFQPENVQRILSMIESKTEDTSLRHSLHFSPGIVDRIERQMKLGCTVIADSNIVYAGIDKEAAARLSVDIKCFMDDPMIVNFATQKRITRAEVAAEHALTVNGPKLIIIGSAPMALNRLLQIHRTTPLREVVIVAAATGFASVVELKEKLWDSGLPCIVIRGRKGGPAAGIAIVNALLEDSLESQQ